MVSIPPKTRWSYYFKMVDDILVNKDVIKIACEMVGIDFLNIAELNYATKFCDALKLMQDLITMLEGDKQCTISNVLPQIVSLKNKLSKKRHQQFIFIDNLIADIDSRFKHVVDPRDSDFNLIYSLATYLDPKTHKYLSSQSLKVYGDLAEKFLHETLSDSVDSTKIIDFDDLDLGSEDVYTEENSEITT